MRFRNHRWLLVMALLLLLAACGPAPAVTQPTPEGEAVADATVSPPAEPEATPTEQPVTPAEPEATPTEQPATTPEAPDTTEVPAEETALPDDGATAEEPSVFGLRRDSVWIVSGDQLLSLGEQGGAMPIETQTGVTVSPDGSRVVFNQGDPMSAVSRLVVKSTITGDVMELGEFEGGAINPVFSPDGGSIAYTTVDGMTGWRLIVVELEQNEQRVLQSGTFMEGQAWLVFVPQRWDEAGLVVSQVAWFGETNSSGLVQVDPSDGTATPVFQQPGLLAALSPDRGTVAAVSGGLPMGGPGNMTLTLIDLASGEETVLADGLPDLWLPEWSPDGQSLAYMDTRFDRAESTLRLFNVDGSPAGDLVFGPETRPGTLRDVAWRDNQTLMLVVVEPDRVVVYEVGRDLATSDLQEVATFDGNMDPSALPRIVYVP